MSVRRRCRGLLGLAGVVLAGLLLAGCSAASKGPSVEGGSTLDLTDAEARAKWTDHFWTREQAPVLTDASNQRVAVAEFVIEFVTEKTEGLTPKEIEFSQYVLDRLPDQAYATFCEVLRGRGFELIPAPVVRSSPAYARFDTQLSGSAAKPRKLEGVSSDTGRATRVVLASPEALPVLKLKNDAEVKAEMEVIAADLREELGADVVMRVRIRVGVYKERATLEAGSVVWMTTREAAGNVTAKRSWLSESRVIEDRQLAIGRGRVINVDVNRYLAAMTAMFSPYVEMALTPK